MKIKVLLLENIHPRAVKSFATENFSIEQNSSSLTEDELLKKIADVNLLCIRSKTEITAKVIKAAKNLWAIGCYCIGTNQVDLEACLEKGIIVFNAPYSNTRSVVEMAIGEIIALLRQIPQKSTYLHQGKWLKSASDSFEVRGKKLGIVGYGNIGSQLSVLAEALGMKVYYYDIVEKLALGNAQKCYSLEELLQTVNIVTIHVDGRASNENFINHRCFELMQPGSYFLNLSRGFVVDIAALAKHLQSGHLLGAAVDVYSEEPVSNSETFRTPLQNLSNVILTPHIGGSTIEAQENIADFVTSQLISYMQTGSSIMNVNFPEIKLPSVSNAHRMIHIHQNTPGVLAYMNELFAEHNINILSQYLKTNEKIGYVITDVSKEYDAKIIDRISDYEHTVRFRILS